MGSCRVRVRIGVRVWARSHVDHSVVRASAAAARNSHQLALGGRGKGFGYEIS